MPEALYVLIVLSDELMILPELSTVNIFFACLRLPPGLFIVPEGLYVSVVPSDGLIMLQDIPTAVNELFAHVTPAIQHDATTSVKS